MAISRRRIWGSFLLAPAAQAQEQTRDLDTIRHVAGAHGVPLTDDRLRILKPILENRKAQLDTLRRFAIDDVIEPTQGIPRK
jgi:hypothetical protein